MTSLAQLDTTQPRRSITPTLRLVPDEPTRRRDRPSPRRDRSRGPDVRRLVAAVAWAVLEVEARRRPLAQLDGVLSPSVALEIAHRQRRLEESERRTGVRSAGPEPGSLVRVVGQDPSEDAYEATALVRTADRVTAIAIRAERYRGSWRIVTFTRPEDRRGA